MFSDHRLLRVVGLSSFVSGVWIAAEEASESLPRYPHRTVNMEFGTSARNGPSLRTIRLHVNRNTDALARSWRSGTRVSPEHVATFAGGSRSTKRS